MKTYGNGLVGEEVTTEIGEVTNAIANGAALCKNNAARPERDTDMLLNYSWGYGPTDPLVFSEAKKAKRYSVGMVAHGDDILVAIEMIARKNGWPVPAGVKKMFG